MNQALIHTDLPLPGIQVVFHGKVRDVYFLEGDLIVMVATDKVSAFDVVLPEGIPYKGQVLDRIATEQLDAATHLAPNWKIATSDPMVTVGHRCEPLKVEMIVRGYIAGSAWRAYQAGERAICGIQLSEGLKENERLLHPITTPTTKADERHDEDISREEIIASGLILGEDYKVIEQYTRALLEERTRITRERGLVLVDMKYEFSKKDGKVVLIDGTHTPDSFRYFYLEGYEERQAKGEPQRQLSKEFVRQWPIEQGFQGKAGQKMSAITPEYTASVSDRYIELYKYITDKTFAKEQTQDVAKRIGDNLLAFLKK